VNAASQAGGRGSCEASEGTFRKNPSQWIVETILSSVVFRNMSSELTPQPDPGRPQRRRRPDDGAAASAADLARALGYEPDDPATWPGNAPAAAGGTAGDAQAEGNAAEKAELLLTDPKAMRALAHPLRVALIELFGVHPTLTATQASEILGESPANCAFHLRTLAKYGFVEEAGGGRGRERPWQAVDTSISLSAHKLEGEQARVAATALGEVWLDSWLTRIRKVFGGRLWPAAWEDASYSSQSMVFLTPDEAVALQAEFRAIIDQYLPRRTDPSRRPAGALPVEISTFAYPRQDLAAALAHPGEEEAGKDDEAQE
jgi:hypothetical protein